MFRDIDFSKLVIRLDISENFVYLETANDRFIGSSEWKIDKEDMDMYISDFDITPRYRDKGYGNFLARVLIDLAKLYHLKTVSLIDGSTLKGFWQKLGFKWRRGNIWKLKI